MDPLAIASGSAALAQLCIKASKQTNDADAYQYYLLIHPSSYLSVLEASSQMLEPSTIMSALYSKA